MPCAAAASVVGAVLVASAVLLGVGAAGAAVPGRVGAEWRGARSAFDLVSSASRASSLSVDRPQATPYSLDTAKNYLYYAYAAYCHMPAPPSGGTAPWDCYWCQNTALNMTVTTILEHEETNTYGYVAVSQDHSLIVVGFRGTELTSLKNWITNLDTAHSKPYEGVPGAEVHEGFYDAFLTVRDRVRSSVNALKGAYPSAKIVVTGHSLGAALSVFASLDLADSLGFASELWNFGLPRTGNDVFSWYFGNSTLISAAYRSVNQKDIVPHLPPRLLGFHHVAQEVWYPSSVTKYVLCNGSGEDPHCSDSIALPDSIEDHLNYLGVDERDGHNHNC